MPGLVPVLTRVKGNLSSPVNYVTGNYVQITIKVWGLSSSRKVPVYIHELLLSSSLRLEISGASYELCAPHIFFFLIPVFWGIAGPAADPRVGFPHTSSTCLSVHSL